MIKRKDPLLERLQMIRPYPQHAVVTHSDLLARNKMKPPVRQRFGQQPRNYRVAHSSLSVTIEISRMSDLPALSQQAIYKLVITHNFSSF
jgi:hypothetical protein